MKKVRDTIAHRRIIVYDEHEGLLLCHDTRPDAAAIGTGKVARTPLATHPRTIPNSRTVTSTRVAPSFTEATDNARVGR
jgi:hypothetical protein